MARLLTNTSPLTLTVAGLEIINGAEPGSLGAKLPEADDLSFWMEFNVNWCRIASKNFDLGFTKIRDILGPGKTQAGTAHYADRTINVLNELRIT